MDRWCIHPALDGLRLLNTKISLVQTIGQYELPGMKTRGGQSIVRARGHAVTRMGRGATRVDGADQGRRGGGGNRRKKIFCGRTKVHSLVHGHEPVVREKWWNPGKNGGTQRKVTEPTSGKET